MTIDDMQRNVETEKPNVDFSAWVDVLNTIEIGVTVISPDLRLEYINDTYREMIDVPESIGPGCAAYDLYFHLADRGDLGEGKPEKLANDDLIAIVNGEWADITRQFSNGRINKIRRDYIEGGYVVTTITDITDIIKSEERISENESMMSMILDATDQGIMIVDRHGMVELINAAYINMLGFVGDPDSAPHSYFDLIEGAWKAGKFSGDEINALSDEDFLFRTVKMVEKSASEPQMLKLTDDKYVRFISRNLKSDRKIFTFTDVTDSKLREIESSKAQQISEDSLVDFNTAINNMDVGLVLLDKDMNTLLINDAFHQIWSTSSDNFQLGENFRQLMDINRGNGVYDVKDEDWESYVQSRVAEIKDGNIEPRELDRADGKVLIYSCTSLSDGQRLVRYSDITEFKQREVALEQAQIQAQMADRSKSEFLANMSHEIRTPMNGVMGMAELLIKSELNPKQRMFSDVILSSSTALLTIINDILDFSKIEAGKLELDPAEFSLSAAIEDVATLVSTSVAEKNLELIVRIQPDLPDRVVGDVGRIRQILTNLIGNAVKFTETGHVFIEVTGGVLDGNVGLKIAVTDTGIGIPKEQLRSVFEKFSQVDGSSTRRHEGTGLGLAITSRLVELMDGEIACNSTINEGSSFWLIIELPIGKSQTQKQTKSIEISGAKIIAIDDNSVNRSILLEQFEAWKLDGTSAASGLEGLAMMRQAATHGERFDVVVLDYHMPDMNGVDVARVIRSDAALQDTAIVMLTSVDNIGETTEFKKLSINAHLTKPARASQLLESIIDVLPASAGSANQTEMHRSLTDNNSNGTPALDSPSEPVNEYVKSTSVLEHSTRTLPSETMPEPDVKSEVATQIAPREDEKIDNTGPTHIDVLVAEDNDVNQMVFEQILEHLNYNFKIVENGKLAVDQIDQLRPTIVLMDVSMPIMNGLDATAKIREMYSDDDPSSYCPIIIGVTAHALKDDREKCINAGMDDYMSKPISPDMLAEKISKWMQKNDRDQAIA